MNSRLLFVLVIVFLGPSFTEAQSGLMLPQSTHRSDWHLGVSDVHTTTLIFPHDVVSVDRGTPDVMTQTLDEVTNIVKVKSGSELMEASSLTVITSGGMVYTFRVTYDRNPTTLTYHLAPLRSSLGILPPAYTPPGPLITPMSYVPPSTASGFPTVATNAVYYPQSRVQSDPRSFGALIKLPGSVDSVGNPMAVNYGRKVINTESVYMTSDRIHRIPFSGRVARDKASGSRLELNDIWIEGDIMYYRFSITCESAIMYDIDFWRFYVIDAKQGKRTAVQEREVDLLQVFTVGNRPSRVHSGEVRTFVVSVNKFTIPDKKRLVLEVFEQDGGRHHRLKVKNKDIVKAGLLAPAASPKLVK